MRSVMREILDEEAEKMKEYFDRGRREEEYEPGDLILLKDVVAGPRDDKWIGPFEVSKMQSQGVVLLRDYKDNKLGLRHPAVAIALTKRYHEREAQQPVEEHQVEKVTGHKKKRQQHWFRVLWSDGNETWEPENNLVDYDEDETTTRATVNQALLDFISAFRD